MELRPLLFGVSALSISARASLCSLRPRPPSALAQAVHEARTPLREGFWYRVTSGTPLPPGTGGCGDGRYLHPSPSVLLSQQVDGRQRCGPAGLPRGKERSQGPLPAARRLRSRPTPATARLSRNPPGPAPGPPPHLPGGSPGVPPASASLARPAGPAPRFLPRPSPLPSPACPLAPGVRGSRQSRRGAWAGAGISQAPDLARVPESFWEEEDKLKGCGALGGPRWHAGGEGGQPARVGWGAGRAVPEWVGEQGAAWALGVAVLLGRVESGLSPGRVPVFSALVKRSVLCALACPSVGRRR